MVTAALCASAAAHADEPTKQQCVAANEKAQALRAQESLGGARALLVTCLASSCPGPVREDCGERLAEIDRVMPTLVFQVKDATGRDVAGVALRVDGKPVRSALGGAAVPIDPGPHTLTLTAGAHGSVTQDVVVREGEKARAVPVVLPYATERDVSDPGHNQRLAGFVVGGTGVAAIIVGAALGVAAKATYDSAVSGDCGGDASRCNGNGVSQISGAHGLAAASTVSFIAGAALAAGGVTLWLTAHRSVGVEATADGARMMLRGSF
jgi:hypothetical protein